MQFELENDSAREADSDIDEDMMNEMTEDMISMASQLKHNTQLMADLVKGDNKVCIITSKQLYLTYSKQTIEEIHGLQAGGGAKLAAETSYLNKLASQTFRGTVAIWMMLFVVCCVFTMLYLFMRLFPKNHYYYH